LESDSDRNQNKAEKKIFTIMRYLRDLRNMQQGYESGLPEIGRKIYFLPLPAF
jgi:hypothetical protein